MCSHVFIVANRYEFVLYVNKVVENSLIFIFLYLYWLGKLGLNSGITEEKTVLDAPDDAKSSPSVSHDVEKKGQRVYDDEDDSVSYSYSFFHIMMGLATLYLMMTITNWYK